MSDLEVRRLTRAGHHAVGGVPGLLMRVSATGAKTWVLRIWITGRRRDLGLGGYPEVSLAEAREKAKDLRARVADGEDPVAQRQADRAQRAARITFDEAARQCLAAKESEFKNAKHRQQWHNTLAHYASPAIGSLPIDTIETAHIVQILQPIWRSKTETATRLRSRLETVLAWATTRGYRSGDNPAKWRGHLDTVLPKPGKIQQTKRHSGMSYSEMPSFMAALRDRKGIAARALEFLILTATRSGEVRGARWAEIDLDQQIWTLPAARMKGNKAHTVPLSQPAMTCLLNLPRFSYTGLIFPAPRGGMLSDSTLGAVLKRMGRNDVTIHGFRSTFRTWAAENTDHHYEVLELSLAHQVGNAVERSYQRGSLFHQRRKLMEAWANFLNANT